MLNSALRRTLSEASITDIVRDKRDALMADIRDQMIAGAKRFGLHVVDVRIKRADLPAENSEAVFRRMQPRAAARRRLQQEAQIKAEADRKVSVITAQPRRMPSRSAARRRRPASAIVSSPKPIADNPENSLPSTAQCKSEQLRQAADAGADQSQVGLLPLLLDANSAA